MHQSLLQMIYAVPQGISLTLNLKPGTYVLLLLRFCHGNVSTSYGCGQSIHHPTEGQPLVTQDMVTVSKTKKSLLGPAIAKVLILAHSVESTLSF